MRNIIRRVYYIIFIVRNTLESFAPSPIIVNSISCSSFLFRKQYHTYRVTNSSTIHFRLCDSPSSSTSHRLIHRDLIVILITKRLLIGRDPHPICGARTHEVIKGSSTWRLYCARSGNARRRMCMNRCTRARIK